MSPSSVSSQSHNLDAASTSDDMPSLQEGLLFSDSLKVPQLHQQLAISPFRPSVSPLTDLARCSRGNRAAFLDFAAASPENLVTGLILGAALDCAPRCPCQSQDFLFWESTLH
jgi:hypothetical protein